MARSKNDLELLSINELWELHQKVLATLRAKIKAQTKMLEQRLKQVNAPASRQVDYRGDPTKLDAAVSWPSFIFSDRDRHIGGALPDPHRMVRH
jgi:hypothetical protein